MGQSTEPTPVLLRFSAGTVARGDYRYFHVLNQGEPESYFIINSVSNYVARFDFFTSTPASWARLLSGIRRATVKVSFINIVEAAVEKITWLEKTGLINTVDHFEIELPVGAKSVRTPEGSCSY